MCKRSCCPPRGGSGPGAIIAVITGLIIVPVALRLLVEVLKLLELITLTIAGIAVLGLITWAAIAWHRRAITPAAPPPAPIMIIPVDPATGLPATTAHRRALTGTGQHAARHPAITASSHHLADVGHLTRTRRAPRT
jgi:hypothetical protein